MRKILDFGVFHSSGNPLYSADQALGNREQFQNIFQDFRLPALHLSFSPTVIKRPPLDQQGARTAPFGKLSRKHISYYAKKQDERKERLIDMVIL
ncbi:hypothetical protein KIS4809_4847 [Bacillus sp. ZZV12-4809]|nr:hypothetical protein KIS4809_4847 [Bacillus sp. ZZV12-4809]